MKRIISNLQRRNVIKASISYAVVGFAILEAADITFPVLEISDQGLKYLLFLQIIGVPGFTDHDSFLIGLSQRFEVSQEL